MQRYVLLCLYKLYTTVYECSTTAKFKIKCASIILKKHKKYNYIFSKDFSQEALMLLSQAWMDIRQHLTTHSSRKRVDTALGNSNYIIFYIAALRNEEQGVDIKAKM